MKQANLDRAVASATGESIRFVRSMGFSLMPMPRVSYPSLGGQSVCKRLLKVVRRQVAKAA